MQKYKNILMGTLVVGLFATAATFALPIPDRWGFTVFDFYWPLASNVLMASLHLGAVLLFVLGIKVYKAKLRLAFIAIAIGILFTAIGTIQLPVIDALDLWGSPYVTMGLIGLPFLVAGFVLFLGSSSLSKLVGNKSWLTKWWVVIPGGLVIGAALGTYLPHIPLPTKESDFDIAMSMNFWMVCLEFAATVLVLQVRKRMGAHYNQTLRYLALALFIGTSAVLVATIDTFLTPHAHGPLMSLVNILAIFAGWFWLSAGYAFAKTKEY